MSEKDPLSFVFQLDGFNDENDFPEEHILKSGTFPTLDADGSLDEQSEE